MSFVKTCAALLAASTLALGCATTSTYSTEWTTAPAYAPPAGVVESVREVVRHTEGNPAGGAAAGALIGAMLFGGESGAQTLFGAAAGAATGAALSQGSYDERTYDVVVRFDDGRRGVFSYRDYSPFAPGDRVVLDGNAPRRIEYSY